MTLTRRQVIAAAAEEEGEMMGVQAREEYYDQWARSFDHQETLLQFEAWLGQHEDPETCSWCTEEVEDGSLVETSEGRLCGKCEADARKEFSHIFEG